MIKMKPAIATNNCRLLSKDANVLQIRFFYYTFVLFISLYAHSKRICKLKIALNDRFRDIGHDEFAVLVIDVHGHFDQPVLLVTLNEIGYLGLAREDVVRKYRLQPLDLGRPSCEKLLSKEVDFQIFGPYAHERHDARCDELSERCGLCVFFVRVERDVIVIFGKLHHLI